jgi:hypothetical protein
MSAMIRRLRLPLALLITLAAAEHPRADVPGDDARQIVHAMAHAVDGVRDYTMTLISQEWSRDGMAPPETLLTKWARPFKVYYKRLSAPHLGREILFAEGWNNGRLKVGVHAWPIDIGVNVNPHGDAAMTDAKHPIDESSLIYLVGMVVDNFRRADERGEATAEDRGVEKIQGRECRRLRIFTSQSITNYTLSRGETLWDVEKKFTAAMAPILYENRSFGWTTPNDARPGQTIRVPRYYAARIDLWVDDTLSLPLLAEIYDERGTMFERFEHRDLRVNVGLGPKDFSPANPAYRF